MLAPNTVWIIANNQADASIQALADEIFAYIREMHEKYMKSKLIDFAVALAFRAL